VRPMHHTDGNAPWLDQTKKTGRQLWYRTHGGPGGGRGKKKASPGGTSSFCCCANREMCAREMCALVNTEFRVAMSPWSTVNRRASQRVAGGGWLFFSGTFSCGCLSGATGVCVVRLFTTWDPVAGPERTPMWLRARGLVARARPHGGGRKTEMSKRAVATAQRGHTGRRSRGYAVVGAGRRGWCVRPDTRG
jgi:hypothetical protein